MKKLAKLCLLLLSALMLTVSCGEAEAQDTTSTDTETEAVTETTALETEAPVESETETEAPKGKIPETVIVSEPATGIYTPRQQSDSLDLKHEEHGQITSITKYIDPTKDMTARAIGDKAAKEMRANFIADFEKNYEYVSRHPDDHVDKMVHVSTFTIINDVIYMTYYANTGTDAEDPAYQEARFAFCPVDDTDNMTIIRLQKVGEKLDGKTVTGVYDTILMHKDEKELYLMWTASIDGMYYRLYCVYDIETATLGPIRPNRFKVGDVTNDFNTKDMIYALGSEGIPIKDMWSDIGIMQKLTSREENGETWYYSGCYSGNFNCIIKSKDLITWEYVADPDFINLSVWENAVYVLNDKVYYFVRQDGCQEGFLTRYDLITGEWDTPALVRDTQSRSDFFMYNGELYLVHGPIDRNGFGILKINHDNLGDSEVVLVCDMKDSLFYPYTLVYGDDLYMSYTVNRKHIRLTKLDLRNYVGE